MRRIRTTIVLVAFGLMSVGGATSASAMTCADGFEDACTVVATVVCGVAAKGHPCLA